MTIFSFSTNIAFDICDKYELWGGGALQSWYFQQTESVQFKVRDFLGSVSKYGTPVSDDTNWFKTLPPKIVLRSTEDERRNAKSYSS